MSRWSPTVERRVPDALRPMDIGSALGNIADGINARRANQYREKKDAEATARYDAGVVRDDEEREYRRGKDSKAEERQETLDTEAARDRKVRREGDFLATRDRAADQGFIDGRQQDQRQAGYRGISAGGQAMGGAMGGAMSNVGDQLRAASEQGPRLSLTRPDDTTESMAFDPTMTKDARDEARTLRVERARDALRPPERDYAGEDIKTYVAKQEYDRTHHVGDFAPNAGGRRSGSGGSVRDPRLTEANTQVDNTRAEVSRLEAHAPKPPDFTDAPVPGQKGRDAFVKDSTVRAKAFTADSNTYQGKLKTAHQRAEKWANISDSLSSMAMGLTGGESVGGQQQISAQREMQELQTTFNARLARAPKDAQTQKEMGQWYAQQAAAINQKYGIRLHPDD